MATMQKGESNQQQSNVGVEGITGVGSPISNEAYNVITALQAKLEGLEAYRKYAKDTNAALWQELTRAELGAVQKLCDELERIVKDGKLRMKEPGRADQH